MHILFLSDNFPPETNAPATRLHEHAREWVRAGARVTVVTCAPNFPEGKLLAGYENRWYQRERIDGIDVVRVKTFLSKNQGFALRTLDYLSFMVSGSLAALLQKRPDVVVATSPQFFAALGGWMVARIRRRPFVFELRDLWPESIRAVGAVRDSWMLRTMERLELFLYRQSRTVVAVTEAFREDLVRRGIDGRKVEVVRNGVDLSSYSPRERDADLARELGLEGKFVVGYVGTHGMAHALERVLEAAELLRDAPHVQLLFVGAGATRDALKERARVLGLANVTFADPQPKAAMPRVWSLCDLALVHLKAEPLFATVIPSKIFEAMGMGVPILFAGPEGEASRIVRSHGAGVVVAPEDPAALAAAIVSRANDPAGQTELRARSRAAAVHFDRSRNAARMLEILAQAAPRATVLPSLLEADVETPAA